MQTARGPFQGVWNLLRFNWHVYVFSISFLILVAFLTVHIPDDFQFYVLFYCIKIVAVILITVIVAWYIYDHSGLYKFKWLKDINKDKPHKIININAGFDETSLLLKNHFNNASIEVYNFYDPKLHTDISTKRGRKAYPELPGTKSVSTSNLPAPDESTDLVFVILSAYNIKDVEERIRFFRELKRILNKGGQIVVLEHLRDVMNFVAFNIGFLKFSTKRSWLKTFKDAGLVMVSEQKITPFISCFTLEDTEIKA